MVKQTPKMTALVVSAIRNLREVQGSTPREIMNYIQAEYNATNPTSESTIQRKLCTALKRGLEYGILKHSQGHYSLNADPETVAPMDDMMIGPMERGCGARRKVRRRKGGCKGGGGGRSRRRRKRGGCGGGGGGRKGRRRRKGRSRGGGRCKSKGRRRRRSRRGGGKKCGGKKRRGGRSRRRRSRRAKCGSRRTGEDVDMLAKDPVEMTGGRHRENVEDSYAYNERDERRSRSRGRQSAGSRSRSPTHSRSSGSSDRERHERNRRDRQVE